MTSGQYVTIRGCAPFDSLNFREDLQRSMRGSYWRGSSSAISFCDFDGCNGAISPSAGGATLAVLLSVVTSLVARSPLVIS